MEKQVSYLSYFSISFEKNYILYWNFDEKSCFVVFFHEWNEWKNPQFNFSSQYLSIERNFFKWDGKVTKIWHLLFHRIWKSRFLPQINFSCRIFEVQNNLTKIYLPTLLFIVSACQILWYFVEKVSKRHVRKWNWRQTEQFHHCVQVSRRQRCLPEVLFEKFGQAIDTSGMVVHIVGHKI